MQESVPRNYRRLEPMLCSSTSTESKHFGTPYLSNFDSSSSRPPRWTPPNGTAVRETDGRKDEGIGFPPPNDDSSVGTRGRRDTVEADSTGRQSKTLAPVLCNRQTPP